MKLTIKIDAANYSTREVMSRVNRLSPSKQHASTLKTLLRF